MHRSVVRRGFRFAAFMTTLMSQAAAVAQLTVVSTDPAANSMTATPGTAIAVSFDRPVDPATVTSNSFWAFGRWSGCGWLGCGGGQ